MLGTAAADAPPLPIAAGQPRSAAAAASTGSRSKTRLLMCTMSSPSSVSRSPYIRIASRVSRCTGIESELNASRMTRSYDARGRSASASRPSPTTVVISARRSARKLNSSGSLASLTTSGSISKNVTR